MPPSQPPFRPGVLFIGSKGHQVDVSIDKQIEDLRREMASDGSWKQLERLAALKKRQGRPALAFLLDAGPEGDKWRLIHQDKVIEEIIRCQELAAQQMAEDSGSVFRDLARNLADNPTFQEWTGTETAEEAAERVHVIDQYGRQRPASFIDLPPGHEVHAVAGPVVPYEGDFWVELRDLDGDPVQYGPFQMLSASMNGGDRDTVSRVGQPVRATIRAQVPDGMELLQRAGIQSIRPGVPVALEGRDQDGEAVFEQMVVHGNAHISAGDPVALNADGRLVLDVARGTISVNEAARREGFRSAIDRTIRIGLVPQGWNREQAEQYADALDGYERTGFEITPAQVHLRLREGAAPAQEYRMLDRNGWTVLQMTADGETWMDLGEYWQTPAGTWQWRTLP